MDYLEWSVMERDGSLINTIINRLDTELPGSFSGQRMNIEAIVLILTGPITSIARQDIQRTPQNTRDSWLFMLPIIVSVLKEKKVSVNDELFNMIKDGL